VYAVAQVVGAILGVGAADYIRDEIRDRVSALVDAHEWRRAASP